MARVIDIRDGGRLSAEKQASVVVLPSRPTGLAAWSRAVLNLLPILGSLGLGLSALAVARGIGAYGVDPHVEGWMLHSILRVRDGLPLYTDYHEYPFNVALYSPLHYYVVGLGARLAGLDAAGTLLLGRVLSAAMLVLSLALVWALGRLSGLSRWAAAIGAAILGASFMVHPWAYSSRPDLLALASALAGLWAALRWPGRAAAVLAGGLLAAAFLAKQTHLSAIAALTLAALWSRRWEQAATLVVTWCTIVGAVLISFQAESAGLLIANLLLPNVLPMSGELALRHALPFAQLAVPLLVLAVLDWRISRRERGCPGRPPLDRSAGRPAELRLYAALAASLGLFSLAKPGSSLNHLLEATVGLAILAAGGLEQLRWRAAGSGRGLAGTWPATRVGRLVVVAALIGLAANLLQPGKLLLQSLNEGDSAELVGAIRDAPGDVLAERDALAVALAGKTAALADPYGLAVLARQGRWDSGPLNRMIEQRAFGLIVLGAPPGAVTMLDDYAWWPPGTAELIARHYRLAGQVGSRYLYAPASP